MGVDGEKIMNSRIKPDQALPPGRIKTSRFLGRLVLIHASE
jgi:hypothetical protein